MDRREAIVRVCGLMGGAMSASLVSGILGGCSTGPADVPFASRTLSPEQNELVALLTEVIIPETDTPGARAARVNEFIDMLLTEWYDSEERDQFLRGVAHVDALAKASYSKPFVELEASEQNALVAALEQEALDFDRREQEKQEQALNEFGQETTREPSDTQASRTEAHEAQPEDPPFFKMIKWLTLSGYYTSEIGATQELRYMPYGTYNGAVPFSEIGRAWS